MDIAIPMKEVYCKTCIMPFLIPFKLVEQRGWNEAILCPGCGHDYRTTGTVPEIQDLKNDLRRVRGEKETLARSNAALRGLLKRVING